MSVLFQQIFSGIDSGGGFRGEFSEIFGLNYFIVIGLSLVTYTVVQTTVAAYLSLYDESGAAPSVKEVWDKSLKSFLPVFIAGIFAFIMVLVGMIFCLIPGIYLAVVLLPYPFVIVNEKLSVFESFNRCFQLIKGNFWQALGIYFLSYLVVFISASAIGLIIGFIGGLLSYFSTERVDTTVGVVTSILNIIQYLFYLVLFVSIGLNYYNLVERKEATGLSRRIDSFGEDNFLNTNKTEEF